MARTGSTIAPSRAQGKLYLRPGLGIYLGQVGDNREHRHWAHQLSLALSGTFEIESQGTTIHSKAVFIQAGTPHRIPPQAMFSIFIEPTIPLAKAIVARLQDHQPISELPEQLEIRLRRWLLNAENFELPLNELENELPLSDMYATNARLSSVLETLQRRTEANEFVTCAELASQAGVSSSRFSHWFKEATGGLTFRSYRKWLRMVCAIERVLNGQPLTQAAHDVAFSDQAHFTRTFVEMFGVTPSSVLSCLSVASTGRCVS